MFGVDRKMVRNWVENEDFFRRQTEDGHQLQEPMAPIAAPSQPNKAPTAQRKRLERNFASGSAARYPELERSLAEWWTVQLSQGQNIKAKALKTQALLLFHNLYPSSSDQDFKASTGWLQRFVARMEAGGTNPAAENQNDNNAQQFPGWFHIYVLMLLAVENNASVKKSSREIFIVKYDETKLSNQ